MNVNMLKQVRRRRRKLRVRKHVIGTVARPRLSVFRSLQHVYAQIVDDVDGKTLAAANSVQLKLPKGGNIAAAKEVGAALAQKAKAAGVTKVVFDRNSYKFHGRVKAVAEGARAGGLKF